ncbi:MAG TPA: pilus assembly protein PilM [Planctomycetota bacterium]|nr:pilus assembly protein PilM [Planctomycetota bacterium]
MATRNKAVGIDLGVHAIKVVELRITPGGVQVLRAIRVDRSDIPSSGEEPGSSAERVHLARFLRARMDEVGISARGVVLGLGGQEAMLKYTRIPPVPSWRLKVIMDYEAGEVAERIGEPLARDFRPLQLVREAEEDQTVLLGLAKEKPLETLLQAFEAEGIVVEAAVPVPVAVFAAHHGFGRKADPESPDDDLLLAADMGAESLSIALVLNDKLAFARSISFGGKNFTAALAQALKLSPEDAEKLKIARGGLDERERGVEASTVMALRSAAGQLLGMLQSSISFSATQTGVKLPPLSRVVLLGGGMRLKGLASFLGKGLGKAAEHFEPAGLVVAPSVAPVAAKVLQERPGEFGAALGLGVSRLGDASRDEGSRTTLTLLPSSYVKRREFKDRTLFLYAAGIFLVIFLAAKLVYAVAQHSSASGVLDQLGRLQKDLDMKKTELAETRRAADGRRARLNRLLQEAEATAFQAFVLDLLPRVLRPDIQIQRIAWVLELTGNDAEEEFALRLIGRVNNEKRQGLAWILELQDVLKAEDRIGRVEEVASRPDGAWYTFELSVTPKYTAY